MRNIAKKAKTGILLNLIVIFSISLSFLAYAAPCTNEAHAYVSQVEKAATETEEGQVRNTCLYCGDSYMETLSATGHVFGDWQVVNEQENGERLEERTCAQCGYTEERTVIIVPVTNPVDSSNPSDTNNKEWKPNAADVVLTTATGGVWGYVGIVLWWNSLVLLWYKRECNKKRKERKKHDNQ